MLAKQTLALIDECIRRDQGASYRKHLQTLLPLADDAYRQDDDPFRSHLGASVIGGECPRAIWYSFHWVTPSSFDGRILRLFNRGHLEEPRLVAALMAAGIQVWQYTDTGGQFRMTGHRGHLGGSLDAVVKGVPEMPNEPVLGEFKTHNDKSFKKLQAEGVRNSKFQHFVQMQMYMGAYNLRHALYLAVNKNDDDLYGEFVPYDQGVHEQFHQRAGMIIAAEEPPKRVNNSPGWFQCRFCDHAPTCHSNKPPARNCRTCVYSCPGEDGKWICRSPEHEVDANEQGWEDEIELDKAAQLEGCRYYTVHPLINMK